MSVFYTVEIGGGIVALKNAFQHLVNHLKTTSKNKVIIAVPQKKTFLDTSKNY